MNLRELLARDRGRPSGGAVDGAPMESGGTLVLIDGVNFFYRGAWSHAEVPDRNGEDVSYVLAFFRNLSRLMRKIGRARYVVCWEGGYDERLRISSEAVAAGLIPKAYKQERREAHETQDPEETAQAASFVRQMAVSRSMLSHTVVGQCRIDGEEADDAIGSLSMKYRDSFDRILLITTDRDYYQLIDEKTVIYDAKDGSEKGLDFLKREYGLSSGKQWIDVGALAGESGKSSDTIYGVKGIGYATAAKMIAEYGTLDKLLDKTRELVAAHRAGDASGLMEQIKSGKAKIAGMARKGVETLAVEPVVRLARKLKEIRRFLDAELPETTPSYTDFTACFQKMGVPFPESERDYMTDICNICGAINKNSASVPEDPENEALF